MSVHFLADNLPQKSYDLPTSHVHEPSAYIHKRLKKFFPNQRELLKKNKFRCERVKLDFLLLVNSFQWAQFLTQLFKRK